MTDRNLDDDRWHVLRLQMSQYERAERMMPRLTESPYFAAMPKLRVTAVLRVALALGLDLLEKEATR